MDTIMTTIESITQSDAAQHTSSSQQMMDEMPDEVQRFMGEKMSQISRLQTQLEEAQGTEMGMHGHDA